MGVRMPVHRWVLSKLLTRLLLETESCRMNHRLLFWNHCKKSWLCCPDSFQTDCWHQAAWFWLEPHFWQDLPQIYFSHVRPISRNTWRKKQLNSKFSKGASNLDVFRNIHWFDSCWKCAIQWDDYRQCLNEVVTTTWRTPALPVLITCDWLRGLIVYLRFYSVGIHKSGRFTYLWATCRLAV